MQNEIKKLKAKRDDGGQAGVGAGSDAHPRAAEGLSVDAEVQALDNVRTHIKTQVRRRTSTKELARRISMRV